MRNLIIPLAIGLLGIPSSTIAQEEPIAREGVSVSDFLVVENLDEGIEIQVVSRPSFSLGYFEPWESAKWVAHLISSEHELGSVKRANNFRADPLICTESAALSDYAGSGFDRGHLVPAQDVSWSTSAMSDSFFLSNISPQLPGFNRGIWKSVERIVRELIPERGTLFIVTGPVVGKDPGTVGENEVAIPHFFYKALLWRSESSDEPPIYTWHGGGFLLAHSIERQSIKESVIPIDQIEAATGLDFFAALPDEIESRVEGELIFAWSDFEFPEPKRSEESEGTNASSQCTGKTISAEDSPKRES